MQLTTWEIQCHCGEYDSTLGNNVWCFYHKGPHPLDSRKGINEVWKKLRTVKK